MVRLGKAVKGKFGSDFNQSSVKTAAGTKPKEEIKRIMNKVRNQDKAMEDLEKEQMTLKLQRDALKNMQI